MNDSTNQWTILVIGVLVGGFIIQLITSVVRYRHSASKSKSDELAILAEARMQASAAPNTAQKPNTIQKSMANATDAPKHNSKATQIAATKVHNVGYRPNAPKATHRHVSYGKHIDNN